MRILENNRSSRAIFLVASAIVVGGKVLNLFMHFDSQTNRILNTFMFCLIGIAYIAESFDVKIVLGKIVGILSGVFLIVMNFIPKNNTLYVFIVIAIIVPWLIFFILKKKANNDEAGSGG